MNSGLDKNETELRVFVLAVSFKVLANSYSLAEQHHEFCELLKD